MFWARGKFPIVAMAFVFDKLDFKSIGLDLFIDGEHVHFHRQKYHNFRVAEDHVLLCDLRVLFSNEELEELDARIGDDRKWMKVTIQVKCETETVIREWGMYVNKRETNMDDIRFMWAYLDDLLSTDDLNELWSAETREESFDDDFEFSILRQFSCASKKPKIDNHFEYDAGTYDRSAGCFVLRKPPKCGVKLRDANGSNTRRRFLLRDRRQRRG
ncbi:hypothetical protein PIB30_026958 [Stylosanthes scabra]|nr:hypothetical protein [Stylosanthes scabra]